MFEVKKCSNCSFGYYRPHPSQPGHCCRIQNNQIDLVITLCKMRSPTLGLLAEREAACRRCCFWWKTPALQCRRSPQQNTPPPCLRLFSGNTRCSWARPHHQANWAVCDLRGDQCDPTTWPWYLKRGKSYEGTHSVTC